MCTFIMSVPFYQIWTKLGYIRPDWIIGGVIIGMGIYYFAKGRPLYINLPIVLVLAFFLSVSISSANLFHEGNKVWVDFITQYAQFTFVILLFLSVAVIRLNHSEIEKIISCWILFAALLSAYGLYQVFAIIFDLPLKHIIYNNFFVENYQSTDLFVELRVRVTSVMAEPNDFARYIVPPLLCSLYSIGRRPNSIMPFKTDVYNVILISTMLSALALSFSMAGYITFLSVIIITLPFRQLRILSWQNVSVVLVSFTLTLFTLSYTGITSAFGQATDRLTNIIYLQEAGGGSLGVRVEAIQEAINTGLKYPILGSGFGLHSNIISSQVREGAYISNLWAGVFARFGLIGLSVLISLFLYIVIYLYNKRSLFSVTSSLCSILLIILISDVVRSNASMNLLYPRLWFMLGISSALLAQVSATSKERVTTREP